MAKSVIDTNLIIRFLVNDDPQKASDVEKLLRDKTSLYLLPDPVAAEIIWVLDSFYGFDKQSIVEKIRALIHVDSIDCNEVLLNRALLFWERYSISFIDAYIAALAQEENMPIYSYDQKFDQIKSVK